MEQVLQNPRRHRTKLSQNQVRGFWAAWGGWALDGMDSFIYALVMVPALLVAFIRYGVRESQRWETERALAKGKRTMCGSFLTIFSREYRRRTLMNSIYLLVSIIGLWAGSVYVPAAVSSLATAAGYAGVEIPRLVSWATVLLSIGTILGCIVLPPLTERCGRRITLGLYFLLMFIFINLSFGYVFYLPEGALFWFLGCLFFLGLGGANFAMYTLWLPEQYRTECRASAFAFATSMGRFVGAAATFLVGAGVSHFNTIGIPVALTSLAFLVGLVLLPFGEETRGRPLPT